MQNLTLLEQAKAFTQRTAGTAALTILPLAAVAFAPDAHAASGVVLNPAPLSFNNGSGFFTSGGSTGSAALAPFGGVTGEKSFGNATFFFEGSGGSFSNYQAVTINGGSGNSGSTFTQGDIVPVKYNFSLSQFGTVALGAWTLIFDLRVGGAGPSGSGVADNTITFSGNGFGAFNGFGNIVIQNLGTSNFSGGQTPFVGYALTFTESGMVGFSGGSFNIDVPTSSFDFNAAAIPEPSTWSMLGLGALALGAYTRRQRIRPGAVA